MRVKTRFAANVLTIIGIFVAGGAANAVADHCCVAQPAPVVQVTR